MSAASLTKEAMRADIAAMLHEPADAVGDGDNLMDLGIDSMRLMNLALQWSEAGAQVEFFELAVHDTLNGWWDVVRAKQAAQP